MRSLALLSSVLLVSASAASAQTSSPSKIHLVPHRAVYDLSVAEAGPRATVTPGPTPETPLPPETRGR